MKYQIVITGPDGEIADTISVVDGAALVLAPGENVQFFDENGDIAKINLKTSGKDAFVTFETGEQIKLIDFDAVPEPSPVVAAAAGAAIPAESEDEEEKEKDSELFPKPVQPIPAPQIPENEETGELQPEPEPDPVSIQTAPVNIAFGAAAANPSAATAEALSVENLVGALPSDGGFSLIRGSDVSFSSHSANGSPEFGGPGNPGTPPAEQDPPEEPTVIVREKNTTRFFSIPTPASGPVNLSPIAEDDIMETTQGLSATIPILENDFDPDGDEITKIIVGGRTLSVGSPVILDSGAVIVLNDDGEIEYNPETSFNFVPAGGTAIDTFSYTIEDARGARDSAEVSVQVNGLNDAPNAVDDPVDVDEDNPTTIPVLDNDGDIDGDPLTIIEVSDPPSGANITINPDGTITYDPNGLFEDLGVGETATDTFSYTIDDGNGGTDTATVTVTIQGQNDASIVNPDTTTLGEDGTTNIPILDNDSDVDGDELCIGFINGQPISEGDTITLPSGATLTLLADGSVDYNTNEAFNNLAVGDAETDSFSYSLCPDHDGFTPTATVTVTVEGRNDDPIAFDDNASTVESAPVAINVLDNDTDVDQGDVLTVIAVETPGKGTATINPDGTISFDPNGDFEALAVGESATQIFDYTISDPNAGTATAKITVTINGENDGPNAVGDISDVAAGDDVNIDVLANDTDVDASDVLAISGITQPTSGAVVSENPDGTLNYDPGSIYHELSVGETATDTFSYSIDDGNGGTDTAQVTVTIHGSNNAPVANDDADTTDEETPVTVDVLDNDTDPNRSDTLTVSGITGQTGDGTATLNLDGSITFDPNGEFEHLADGETAVTEVTYAINDGHGQSDTATLTITINGVNDTPDVADDIASTTEGAAVSIDVLDNDSDIDTTDILTVANVTAPASGATVSINPDNTVEYDPNGQFESLADGETATDSFSYTADDGNGGTQTANVTVTIFGDNDGPDAIDDTATTDEDSPTTIDLLANDLDVDTTDVLSISEIIQPTSGAVVSLNPDGTVEYDPNGSFESLATGETTTDTFTYKIDDGNGGTDFATVTVTITGVNDAPGINDDSATTTESAVVAIDVLANDTDVDNSDTLTVNSVSTTTSGATVTINPDNTVSYDPDGNFEELADGETAIDNFTYSVDDGNGGTDTANVRVTVFGENDGPEAIDDAAITNEDTSTTIDVLANDSDIDTTDVLSISEIIQPTSGAVVTLNPDGTVDYDPNGSFEELAAGETSTDNFTYKIDDGNGGTDFASVTVTLTGVNDAPGVNDDAATTTESAIVTIDVLANDTDIDETDILTVTGVSTTTSGAAVTINPDSKVSYDPDGKFEQLADGETAIDNFTYSVDDGNGGTDTANVTVTVFGENDGPEAIDDVVITNEDTSTTIDVLANDSDIDTTDVLTISEIIQPTSGATVSENADGTLNYDPNGAFETLADGETATDTFSYKIDDGNGGTDIATVTVTINGVNDTPDAIDDSATTTEEASVSIDVLENDTDIDTTNVLTVASVSDPTGLATATINPDNTITYDPNGKFNALADGETATDTFSYISDDGNGGTESANVTVTVFGENDTPEAVDDTGATDEDTLVNVDVLGNDFDPDTSDVLTISNVTASTSGASVSINATGGVDYNPDGAFEYLSAGETAIDTFVYTIDDGNGGTDSATATITITGVNDSPGAVDDTATTTESALINIAVLANDTDVDIDDSHGVDSVTQPTSGAVVTINPDNTVRYNPSGNFEYLANGETATDTFTYVMKDNNGATASATVTITIFGENDGPDASNDTATVTEDASVLIPVLDNDTDTDTTDDLTVTHFNGATVAEGITVTLPSGGQIELRPDGTVNYLTNGAFDGLAVGEDATDIFSYTIDDGNGGTDTANVTVTISGENDTPDVADDTARTDEDTAVNIDVLSNDFDVDDTDELTVLEINGSTITESVSFNLPSGATVTLLPDGTLDFDPGSAFDYVSVGATAIETFEYTASDGNGGTETANVTITIDGINDPPVAVDDPAFEAMEDGPSAFHDITPLIAGQDFDAEGDVFVVGINGTRYNDGDRVDLASGAYVIMNADGVIEYNANDAFHAELDLGETFVETLTYTIEDEEGAEATATFQVNVIGQNDAPVLNHDCSFGNTPGEPVTIDILANDVDIDGAIMPDTMTIGGVDLDPSTDGIQKEYFVEGQGTWTVNPDNTITFAPEPELAGDPDPIMYAVADNQGEFGEPADVQISYFTADMWFANDLSGSVDSTEYQQSIDLITGTAAEVEFGSGAGGNQMGMISWGGTDEQNVDVPLTRDQAGFIDAVNNDDRDLTGPVKTDLAQAIEFSLDSIEDPATGSRWASGVTPILTMMTDIHPDQLFNRDPYDDPFYPQDQVARIQAAAERAESLGVKLVFVPIEDAARSPEAINFFESVAGKGPDGSPLVFSAGDYDDIGPDTFSGMVDQLKAASAPDDHVCEVVTPIAIDFNGDNVIEYDSVSQGFAFDIDGDHMVEHMAWVGNDEAVLIYDRDQDGTVSHRSEFILSDWTRDHDTDLQAVATFFDSNQDGVFNARDGEFEKFAIWNDANGNHQVETGEWQTLLDAGVIGFETVGNGQYAVHANGDVEVHSQTQFQMQNGDTILAEDAGFRFTNDAPTPTPDETLTPASDSEPIITMNAESGETIAIDPAPAPTGIGHDGFSIEETTNNAPVQAPSPTTAEDEAAIAAAQVA